MIIVNLIAFIIILLGAINWGLVGIFNWNLVGAIMGGTLAAGAIIIYILVALSAIWLIISAIMTRGMIDINPRNK